MSAKSLAQSTRACLMAGSALGLTTLAATGACAQGAASAPTPLNGVEVLAPAPTDYEAVQPSISKLTQPILDTPQQITTITRQAMDDQGFTSLNDVFRDVSGISLGAGESSWQGTNLTMRGFNARNDIYLDGMRDFGSYYRDPFDLEEVEVLQGPSSMLFGRGSTGGVVNQVSKTPTLAGHIQTEGVLGTDDTKRLTADIDEPLPQLGQGAAFRLDLMDHDFKVAGRSTGEYERYGVAPSLALGLGTPTRLTISYFHQSEDDLPDYGIPWLLGAPAPVPRDTFYGFRTDYLKTQADVATVKLEHDFGSDINVRSQLRYANYGRDWRDTEPQPVTTGVTAATPLANIVVNRAIQAGHSRDLMFQDQTDLTAKFRTGVIEHTLVAGFEVGPESSKPEYDNATGVPAATLLAPNTAQPYAGTIYPRAIVSTTAFTVAGYAADTMKFGEHWELTGGIRYDRFQSDYEAQFYSVPPAPLDVPTTHTSDKRVDEAPSYRGSVVYKPVPIGTIYFDYSTSFNPSAESLSEIVAVRSFNQGNLNLAPEKNRTFEFGTKWNLLGKRLLLQAAVFREEKYNARVPDPLHSGFNILGGDQRVDGGEVELSGHLTNRWQITAGYTYLDSKVIKSAPGGPAVGMALFNAPKNNANLWTTYLLPHAVTIGAGLDYMSSRLGANTPPIETAPGYTTFDAMIRYQITPNLKAQLNAYNLTDKYYYDQIHGFHIIPGPGRYALFSLALAL